MSTLARSRTLEGIWRIADPKITLASAASLLLGLCFAAHDGPLHWGWAAVTILGIFFLEAAKNASGELFDFDSGGHAGDEREQRFSVGFSGSGPAQHGIKDCSAPRRAESRQPRSDGKVTPNCFGMFRRD